MTPSSAQQGQTLTVTVAGSNFVATPTADFGAGITINSVTFNSSTNLSVGLTVAGGATTGSRTVIITNPNNQSGTLSNGFSVTNAPPTVSSVSPNTGDLGQTLSVNITGTNFQSGASSSFGSGITVNSTTFNSATSLTASITIATSATLGARTVTVTNPDNQSAALGGGFTVTAPAPTVTQATPNSGLVGQTLSVTITGTGFRSGATSSFGAGVTVNSTTVNSWTQITASITISSTASTGARTVTVTNSDTQSGSLSNGFNVVAQPPSITSITPTQGNQGSTLNVTIQGANFQNGATSSFGTGITVNSTTFNTSSQLTANITIAAGASTGTRSVTVTNPDTQTATLNNAFTVLAPALTVSSVSPTQGGQGATLDVQVNGTNFQTGATVTFSDGGVTINSTSVNGSTQIVVNITIASSATVGARDVTVTNPDTQTATLAGGFTITAPAPTVTAVSPTQGGQGSLLDLTVTGTGFQAGATTSFSGTGITVNSTTVNSSTQLTVNILISSSATLGARDVTVTNADSQFGTLTSAFSVIAPAPTVTSLNPSQGTQGTTLAVTITGANFQSGATADFGVAGVTVNSTTFVSSSELTASITISSTATTGARTVTVTNPDTQTGTLTNGFTVLAPAPTVSAVSPTQGTQGATVSVTITGTDFQNGATSSFGTGVTVNSTTFNSSTQLTASITIASTATTGARDVTVTNPDSQSGVLTGGFAVVGPAPTLTSVTPNQGVQGDTNLIVVLTGTNFVSGATATFGAAVTVNSVTFNSATQLTADLTIPTTSPTGARDVTVTLPDTQTTTLTGGFTVLAPAPTITSIAPNQGVIGTTFDVVITGTGYQTGATVSLGTGVSINSVTVDSATQITANITVGSNATLGARNLTVTNPDTQSATATSAFAVIGPAPTVSSVTPNQGVQGAALSVIIAGGNFQNGATADFGAGITVNSVTFVSAAQLTASILVDSAAATGTRTVTVTNPDSQSGTLNGGFTVLAPAPTITGVSPSQGTQGQTLTVTVSGTNFQTGASVDFGAGIAINSVSGSGTSLSVTLTISASAATGTRTVTVTNPDSQSATRTNAFQVLGPGPTLSSVTPNQGTQGATLTVILAGTNFQTGASVSFGAGVTVNTVTVDSANQITVGATIGAGATVGARDVTVTNPDTQSTMLASGFTVNAPTPTVTSVSPASGQQGTAVSVIITGANFDSGASVSVSGTGVTVSAVTFVSSTQLTATFDIGSAATLGIRAVTVTNGSGQSGTLSNAFQVLAPAPTVSSLSPNRAPQGSVNLDVTIIGANFQSGATADLGAGITLNTVSFVSSTQLTVNVSIDAAATLGSRDVTVTNPDTQTGTAANAFQVLAPAPTVSQSTPNQGDQGGTLAVVLTGANFQAGATADFGTGIAVNGVTFNSSTQLTVTVSISSSATVGARDVTVTNPDGQSGALASGFEVLSPAPAITGVSPALGAQGATSLTVTITGSGFQTGASSSFGPGITVNSTSVTSATTIQATVSIDVAATLGLRDVTVTNPDTRSALLTNGFQVVAPAPTVTAVNPDAGALGQTLSVAITGTNFQSGATATFGSGVTVNSVTLSSTTQLTAQLTISPSATPGARDVVVTNPDSQSGTGAGLFTVLSAGPNVLGLNPPSGKQGQTLDVVITGANLQATPSVDFGAGITVNRVTFDSAIQLTVNITIDAAAALGARTITLTNPDTQSTTLANGFTVTDGIPPTVTGCSASVTGGGQMTVTFDEDVVQTDAETVTSYTVVQGTTVIDLTGATAAYQSLTRTVTITGAAMNFVSGQTFTVTVVNVRDLNGNAIVADGNGNVCSATVGDQAPPTVAGCAATQGANGGEIAITFSENMDSTTAGLVANYAVVRNGSPLNLTGASATYDSTTFTVTLSGGGVSLLSGDSFSVTVTRVQDVSGNVIVANGTTNVCSGTVGDRVPPTVISCSAASGGGTIAALFSEPVIQADAETVGNYALTVGGNPIDLTGAVATYNATTRTVTITSANIAVQTGDTFTLNVANVRDTSGNAIASAGVDCTGSVGALGPPQVVACDAAQVADLSGELRVTFSGDINATDAVNVANYSVTHDGAPLALLNVSLSYDNQTFTVTINGAGMALVAGKAYSVVVANIRGANGQALDVNNNTCTGTVRDAVPPLAQACAVRDTGGGLAVVEVTFSEPVQQTDAANGANYQVTIAGGQLDLTAATLAYDAVARRVTISGTGVLATAGQAFTIGVFNVRDLSGNSIVTGGSACTGTVGDSTPPTVTGCVATAGATAGSITATFSEAVQQADAEAPSNYVLTDNGAPVSLNQATLTYDAATNSVTIDQVAITSGAQVSLTATGVRDTAGNAIVANGLTNVCVVVVNDQQPPTVVACSATESATSAVSVTFSENVDQTAAETAANYAITVGTAPVDLTNAALSYNATTFTTTISGVVVTARQAFTVTVTNVADTSANVILADGVGNVCSGTVSDQLPPKVSSCDAAATSQSAGYVSITFSESMTPADVQTIGNYALTQDGAPLSLTNATAVYDDASRTVVILGVAVGVGKSVNAVVTNVRDVAGIAMPANGVDNVCSTAATVRDEIPPVIVSCAVHVRSVSVTFSEAMLGAGLIQNYQVESPAGTALSMTGASVAYDSQTNTATLSGFRFQGGQAVVVRVSAVTDASGNALTGAAQCSLTLPRRTCQFSPGVYTVTIPASYRNADLNFTTLGDIFGEGFRAIAVYDSGRFVVRTRLEDNANSILPPDVVSLGLQSRGIGVGFFLKMNAAATVDLLGDPLDLNQSFTTNRLPDDTWSLFGNPWYGRKLDWTRLQYTVDGLPPANVSSLWTAALSGGDRPLDPWAWAVENGTRVLVADPSGAPFLAGVARPTLNECQAVWVRTRRAGVRLVAPVSTQTSSVAQRARASATGWTAQLEVASETGASSRAYFGFTGEANRALRLSAPPPVEKQPAVDIAAIESGQPLGVAVRAGVTASTRWTFAVACGRAGDTVTVRWSELNQVLPRSWRAVLVDLETGVRRAMRSSSSYSFRTPAAGTSVYERRLAVELVPASQDQIRVTGVHARNVAGGAQIQFMLTRAADVHVRILSPTGRTVAVLPAVAAAPGLNAVTWNRRDASNRSVPRGVYLIEVIARDDDGATARAMNALTLR